jgi:hypothetical protein
MRPPVSFQCKPIILWGLWDFKHVVDITYYVLLYAQRYNHCLKNTIVTAEIMGTFSKNAVKSAVKTLCSPVFVKQETEKSP